MKCPKCKSEQLRTINSRPTDGGIKRRRMCLDCNYRFNTYEIDEDRYEALKEKTAFLKKLVELAKEV